MFSQGTNNPLNASEYPDIQTIGEKQYVAFQFEPSQYDAVDTLLTGNNVTFISSDLSVDPATLAIYVPVEEAETARSAFGLPSKDFPSPAPVQPTPQVAQPASPPSYAESMQGREAQPPAYQAPAQQLASPPSYQQAMQGKPSDPQPQPVQQQPAEAAKETKTNPVAGFFKDMGAKFKESLDQNRYVVGATGKVADAYKPSRNPLSWIANGANFVANAVGAGIKAATWGIGEGLKRLGTLAGKPFEMSRDLITKEDATTGQRIGGVIGMIAATPLKALGMATSIAGQAVKSTGEVAANVMAVGGAVARGALSFGTTSGNAKNAWKQITKTVASVGHVATDLVKETGTQVKELGNQAAIPGVSHALRGAGALAQGAAQVGEGVLQGTRKLAVLEGKEAGKIFGQSVASGAKTIVAEVKNMVTEAKEGVVSGRNTTHTPETRMMPESVDKHMSRSASAYNQKTQKQTIEEADKSDKLKRAEERVNQDKQEDKTGRRADRHVKKAEKLLDKEMAVRHTPSQSEAVEAARAGTKSGFDVETDTAMKKAAVAARPLKDLKQEVDNQTALKVAAEGAHNTKGASKAQEKFGKAQTKLKAAEGEYKEVAKEAKGKFEKMVTERASNAKTTMGRQ